MSDLLLNTLISWQATHAHDKNLWVVAYSGGVDSHVLLHACSQLRQQNPSINLRAVHIDHQLHPQSKQWADHCCLVGQGLGVSVQVLTVATKPLAGESIEAWARQQRYALIAENLKPNELLLTAQNQDDQAETLLMNVFRGSGIKGLSCMPVRKAFESSELHRPLLTCSRADIEAYAQQHQLTWIEDPSNADVKYLRNFIRHQVMPLIKQRMPGVTQAMVRTCSHNQEALKILEDMATLDGQSVMDEHHCLLTEPLSQLPLYRQKNLVRSWIVRHEHPLPPMERLHTLLEQMNAQSDKQPCIRWQNSSIKRFKKKWYIQKDLAPEPFHIHWQGEEEVRLPSGKVIQVTKKIGQGVRLPTETHVILTSPRGSIVAKPHHRKVSKPLKKWWQDYQVPPWERDQWPLVYINQELAAIPGLFVSHGWQVGPQEEGLCFEFK